MTPGDGPPAPARLSHGGYLESNNPREVPSPSGNLIRCSWLLERFVLTSASVPQLPRPRCRVFGSDRAVVARLVVASLLQTWGEREPGLIARPRASAFEQRSLTLARQPLTTE